MIRMPSRTDWNAPFASPSSSSGSIALSIADLAAAEDVAAEAVERRHEIDEPHLALVVHEEQQADDAGHRDVRRDHQRSLAHAVDEQSAERRGEAREREDEEDETGLRVRAGQHLGPDAEDDDHRPVAEHRERLPREEQTHVAAAEQRAHQAARKTRKSPLTVLPRTTSDRPVVRSLRRDRCRAGPRR